MATIKKAQTGSVLPKALKAKGTPSLKNSGYKPSTSEEIAKVKKYVPKAQFGKIIKEGVEKAAEKVAPKIDSKIMQGAVKKAGREDLRAKMAKWDTEMLSKKKNGGSLSAVNKTSSKRVGPVDPKGAFTKVQKKTLASAKGKASLTKDKQLGATKMAKCGAKMPKKK